MLLAGGFGPGSANYQLNGPWDVVLDGAGSMFSAPHGRGHLCQVHKGKVPALRHQVGSPDIALSNPHEGRVPS